MSDDKYQSLMKTGAAAASAIVEMVAALECDYDRLEELQAERDEWLAENSLTCKWDNEKEYDELKAAAGECESREDAETRIQEDALSVEVRSGWQSMGDTLEASEFCILLSTGGPAVRIIGDVDNGEISRPRL